MPHGWQNNEYALQIRLVTLDNKQILDNNKSNIQFMG